MCCGSLGLGDDGVHFNIGPLVRTVPCPVAARVAAEVKYAEALASKAFGVGEREGGAVEALRCPRAGEEPVAIKVFEGVDDPDCGGDLVKGDLFSLDSAEGHLGGREVEDAGLAWVLGERTGVF